MKYLYLFVALTIVVAVEVTPTNAAGKPKEGLEAVAEAGTGEYTRDGGSDFFIEDLDSIQGALEDIESAGKDLEVLEAQLQTLVENKALIFAAEEAIEDGVNAENIKNDFKHD